MFIREFLGFAIFTIIRPVELWICDTVDIDKFVSELTIVRLVVNIVMLALVVNNKFWQLLNLLLA